MELAKDGGSAFPHERTDPFGRRAAPSKGMQLRDYFAAKALQGLYAGGKANEHVSDAMLAKWAYAMADAMLAERAK